MIVPYSAFMRSDDMSRYTDGYWRRAYGYQGLFNEIKEIKDLKILSDF